MTTRTHPFSWLAPFAMALAALLAADALAQAPKPAPAVTAGPAVAATEDMRLWSFGDCDRRFPYVNTDAHKECVRVVGSPEARGARALRVCETSNGTDREEAERCKSAYHENKQKAALAANSPAGALAPPSAEVMRRVKAITIAAVEEQRAAAETEAPPVEEPAAAQVQAEPESSSASTVSVVLLVVALAGLGARAMRRKQPQSA